MARQTPKYKAARAFALDTDMPHMPSDAEALYKRLAEAGVCWDSQSSKWTPTKRPVRQDGTKSTSMFSEDDNTPSGVYRLRVMGHPQDIDRLVALLKEHLTIIETSDLYENRKGDGMRCYLTGTLPKTQLRGRRARSK